MDWCGVMFGLVVFGIVYLMSKHPEAVKGVLSDIARRAGGEPQPQSPAKPEGEKDDGK
jgi:hypothetical protein